MSVLSAGGVTPVKGTQDQLLQSLYKLLQVQKATAFSAAGTATVLTLTPSPAISAYATNQRFTVKFPVNSGLNPTLNVSAKGAKNLKQYDATGAKVAAVFFADQISDVVYDGTDFVLLDQLLSAGSGSVQGAFKNLAVSASGLGPVCSVVADELCVGNGAGGYQTLRSVNLTPSFAVAGVNGLDVGSPGSQTASTWYSVWVIWNGTTVSSLLSLSAISPSLPAGYTHRARVGWFLTDATANKYPFSSLQYGRNGYFRVAAGTNYASPRAIASGTTSGAYVATSVAQHCPPTASVIMLRLHSSNANNVVGAVAPNTSYGALTAGTPPTFATSFAPVVLTTPTNASPYDMRRGSVPLEGANIYYLSNSSTVTLLADGWEDNL